MSAHIDHGDKAREILADYPGNALVDQARDFLALAQVHATLALVDAVREVGALLAAIDTTTVVDDGSLVTEGGMEVRPGDPDPTPDYPEGGFCGARSPEEGRICTMQALHEGVHIAGNGQIAVEVWS